MNKNKIKEFEELLVAKRRLIAGELETLRKSGLSQVNDGPMDVGDESVQTYDKQVSLEVSESERETLRQIDDALDRLKNGEYGLCANCGEAITDARLKALPYADKCVQCKAEEESRGR